jgi:26S proteasome regulatory subunit T5
MSTLEDLDDLEREQKEEKKDEDKKDKDGKKDGKENGKAGGDAEMKDAEPEEEDDPIFDEIEILSTQDIITRRRLLENDSRIMKSEFARLSHEKDTMRDKIKDNNDKIENNRHVYATTILRLVANSRSGNYRTSLAT